jgi:hypothetical protein
MRKSILSSLIVLTLMITLASATVSTDKTSYTGNELVTVSSSCTGDSILEVYNAKDLLVTVEQGSSNWTTSYHTASDPSDGKYELNLVCNGKVETSYYFCVDDPTCLDVAVKPKPEPQTSGSGSGGGCFPIWEGTWSYCNNTLQQDKVSLDTKCRRGTRREVRACSPCEYSWTCSDWSNKAEDCGTRKCVDEHSCNTLKQKPFESKACVLGSSLPKVQKPAPFYQKILEPSFWSSWMWWLVGVIAVLLIAGLVVWLVYFRHKDVQWNMADLETWISRERGMGTNDADIRQILKDQTGWTDDEISKAFAGVGGHHTAGTTPVDRPQVVQHGGPEEGKPPVS